MASTKAHTGMPASQFVIPDSAAVIPDSAAVIPDSATVIPDSIRDPVLRHHWIAGQARNDKSVVTPRLIRGPNDSAAFDLIGSVMNFRNVNRPPFFKAERQ